MDNTTMLSSTITTEKTPLYHVDLFESPKLFQGIPSRPRPKPTHLARRRASTRIPRCYRQASLATIQEGMEWVPQPLTDDNRTTEKQAAAHNIVAFFEGFTSVILPAVSLAVDQSATIPGEVARDSHALTTIETLDHWTVCRLDPMDYTSSTHKRVTHHRSKLVLC